MTRLPLLLAASVLILGGTLRLILAGTVDGWAGVSIGALMLGVWLTVELHDKWHNDKEDK